MGLVGGLIWGGIAAVLGAFGWGGIAYATGYEIGWIAWIIGGLVGIGVAMGDKGRSGMMAGLVAAVIAVLSVCAGKYLCITWILNKGPSDQERVEMIEQAMGDPDLVVAYVADQIVEEREAAGQTINWPQNVNPDGPIRDEYPSELWQEAWNRWQAKSMQEQQQIANEIRIAITANFDTFLSEHRGEMARAGFLQSFGAMDIVFMLLAVVTAFKIAGSGEIGGTEV